MFMFMFFIFIFLIFQLFVVNRITPSEKLYSSRENFQSIAQKQADAAFVSNSSIDVKYGFFFKQIM